MTFKDAVRLVLNIEGGEVNDKYDPGGETKYGISKKAYPYLNIENLSIEDAEEIYKRDYWDEVHADELPEFLRLALFDSAVNCGISQAVKFLQETLQVHVDGVIGSQTILACNNHPSNDSELLALYLANRGMFCASLDTFSRFGKGWLKRLFIIATQKE